MLVETSRFLEYTVQNCKIITVIIPEINGKNINVTFKILYLNFLVDIKKERNKIEYPDISIMNMLKNIFSNLFKSL